MTNVMEKVVFFILLMVFTLVTGKMTFVKDMECSTKKIKVSIMAIGKMIINME